MHPAYSVIAFTTVSGAGYGLLMWLCFLGAHEFIPIDPMLGLIGFGLALAMITFGLLASTLHLGHPERAWRAISQWRSSWLSREGLFALVTYIPALTIAAIWFFRGTMPWYGQFIAWVTAILALHTVYCTGMIYRVLRTIRQWDQPLTPWAYLALSLSTGAILMCALLFAFGYGTNWMLWSAIAACLVAAVVKIFYWSKIDNAPKKYTTESATGLGRFGKVRQVEAAHTQANFVQREMGYAIARKHAQKLRRISMLAVFVVPSVLLLIPVVLGLNYGLFMSLLAVVSAGIGVAVERWLFFAEAEHVVNVYYGMDAA